MENEQKTEEKKTFKQLVARLHEIRALMNQETITCEFSGDRILVISKENVPEYLGPEFEVGSLDILPESHNIPEVKGIMDSLAGSELLSVYKSY
ncbi:MAG: hypothetical protein WC788_04685 [Candidatus Paceibacterota bacterium]|jgi:hypothetical protein